MQDSAEKKLTLSIPSMEEKILEGRDNQERFAFS
jgi:hypothetical protein